jgi:site-specific DNA-methyltransferase (adenine-specific)
MVHNIYKIYNEDCVGGLKKHIADKSVDLVIADPPFGIKESTFEKHYNRNEENVLGGYVEAPDNYYQFTLDWLTECNRVLDDKGSIYIVSGWSRLRDVLNAIDAVDLHVINHIVWRFNFGLFTKTKFVTSHYHILYLKKDKKTKVTFNTNCRFSGNDRDENGRSLLYRDLEDVWNIKKEYHKGKQKNRNKLPDRLVEKMILYSSNPADIVLDPFLGNFTTAFAAQRLGRVPIGFEINEITFNHNIALLNQ